MTISPNPNDFDCIVIFIPKSVIEQQDLDFTLSGLENLLVDDETIRKSKGKVVIGFDGYDDDTRELYEIDEVRDYIQALTLKFPYWFYFCNTNDHSLWIILLAHCKFRKSGPGIANIVNKDAEEIYSALLASLLNFYKKHNIDESEFAVLSKEVGEYFASQRIPTIE